MWILYFYNTESCKELLKQVNALKLNVKLVKIEKDKAPKMIRGVPSLINTDKKLIFEGNQAFDVVERIKKMKFKSDAIEKKKAAFRKPRDKLKSKNTVHNMQPTTKIDAELTPEYISNIIEQRKIMLLNAQPNQS
tara:strand:- start:23 stop:427 length:405 start_codon:yes stop_codon:yes gene_type:complete